MTRTGAVHYSELATVRRCPQKHKYAYVEGLRSKRGALNLKRGLWLHAMLQADALKRGLEHGSLLKVPETINVPGIDEPVIVERSGELIRGHDRGTEFDLIAKVELSWKGMLELLEEHSDYALLPESVIEERYTEGGQDLPTACRNIMRGYLWQYRDVLPKRRPLLVEVEWQRVLKDYGPVDVDMEGRIDLVEIDERGLVVLSDWKSTKSIPGQEFKLMESQRWIYLWGIEPILREHGIEVQALALDYLVTSTPTKPTQNQPKKPPKTKSKCKNCDGTGDIDTGGDPGYETKTCPACEGTGKRINMPTPNELKGELSTRAIKTTPLVYFEALREYGLEMTDHHRQVINELERDNAFFKRFVMPVNQKVLVTVLTETAQAAETAERFRRAPGLAYRNVDRSCTYACDFIDLCSAELYGNDADTVRARDFEKKD